MVGFPLREDQSGRIFWIVRRVDILVLWFMPVVGENGQAKP
jgi:hypothetical protein